MNHERPYHTGGREAEAQRRQAEALMRARKQQSAKSPGHWDLDSLTRSSGDEIREAPQNYQPPAYGGNPEGGYGQRPPPGNPAGGYGQRPTPGSPPQGYGQKNQQTGGRAPGYRQNPGGYPDRQRGPRHGGQPPRRPPRHGPRSQNRWFRALVMTLATIAGCIFLSIFIISSASDLFGLNQPDEHIPITIPPGSSVADVSRMLREVGVLDQPFTFRMYLGFKEVTDYDITPGDYVFNSNMAYDEIIIALRSGRTARDERRITFIEGMTMLEIAKVLEEQGVCNADDFIAYLGSADYNFEFIGAIDADPLRFHKLEGYLFPDTYDFFVGENVESVARKFLRNMDSKLTPDILTRMQQMNMTIDETIILASVIQKEAGFFDDMAHVSSVFHNRLRSADFPRLESDVTINYVEENIKPRLSITNQPMYDAYNTYVREGLPVGAVSNPGLDAIEAALYPEDTPFFFFLTDVNMDFYFAVTVAQHNANWARAQELGEVHGLGIEGS
jgi:UPF0755 protein